MQTAEHPDFKHKYQSLISGNLMREMDFVEMLQDAIIKAPLEFPFADKRRQYRIAETDVDVVRNIPAVAVLYSLEDDGSIFFRDLALLPQ